MNVLSRTLIPVGGHHAAVVAALCGQCLEDAWSEAAVAAILATPGAFGFIALISDAPTAFILCRAAAKECEVLALGTVVGERRNGMARDLLERAIGEAHVRGARRMVLEVAEDNEPARGLYARCGFSMIGHRPRYYRRSSGFPADALILSREWGIHRGNPCENRD